MKGVRKNVSKSWGTHQLHVDAYGHDAIWELEAPCAEEKK